MSLLQKIQTALSPLGIPVETGVLSGEAPVQYLVVVPMTDTYEVHADNLPGMDVEEARIAFYSKTAYTELKRKAERLLLSAGLTVTGRHYIGYEPGTGYHHFNVDVSQYYEIKEE